MANLKEKIIITNITKVKIGNYGLYITLVGYKTPVPESSIDDTYMMNISLDSHSFRGLLLEFGIEYEPDKFTVGDAVPIPNGIEVIVHCDNVRSDLRNMRVKYINRVSSIKYIGKVKADIDDYFDLSKITFHDWGITIVKKKDGYKTHDMLFLNEHLPFKSSSVMESFKKILRTGDIRLFGHSPVSYATYKDKYKNIWRIAYSFSFDSRYDDPGSFGMKIVDQIPNLKKMYIDSLVDFRNNSSYSFFLKRVMTEWTRSFVSVPSIVKDASTIGIVLDPVVISTIFFLDCKDEKRIYDRMKSALPASITHFYKKTDIIKYVVLKFINNDIDDSSCILCVYDVNSKKIYMLRYSMIENADKIMYKIEKNRTVSISGLLANDPNGILLLSNGFLNDLNEDDWIRNVEKLAYMSCMERRDSSLLFSD